MKYPSTVQRGVGHLAFSVPANQLKSIEIDYCPSELLLSPKCHGLVVVTPFIVVILQGTVSSL